ncbi:endo-1,3-beta glucanase [Coniothyrium glycines]
MGRTYSKPTASIASTPPKEDTWRGQWRDKRRSIGFPFTSRIMPEPEELPPDNIFVPIQQDSILPQIPIGRHHPVPLTGIEDDDDRTLHTNKFYANSFLGGQDQPIWTHPYMMWWGKGAQEGDVLPTWGMNVAHVHDEDVVFRRGDWAKSSTYPRQKSLILSARELELASKTFLSTDTHLPFSVNINLNHPSAPSEPKITFPVVQGMVFVTAGYRDATPTIQTDGKGFADISGPFIVGRSVKYRVSDMMGRVWLIYITSVPGVDYDRTKIIRLDPNTILGPSGFKGIIQVARNPMGVEGEAIYDRAAATFVCEARLSAVVNDTRGTYSFHYTKIGIGPLLMFVLPHHLESLDPNLKSHVTRLQLHTTTKGMATAVWGEKLTFAENSLPSTMCFGPWHPSMASFAKVRYPPEVLAFIGAVAERDLRRAMFEPINPDSIYHAGRSLFKFATILWVIKDVLGNDALLATGLDSLKHIMARYISNQQRWPIYYDDSWKGIVCNRGFDDPGADFGNTYYNDHHVHWAYFVYAAAVIGYLDPEWVRLSDNKAWTNMLVKDFAEADYNDRDYPFSRCFDWWHGHS